MTRRKLTMLIVLLSLTMYSGDPPDTAKPVVEVPVVQEPEPSHHELLNEWREQLLTDIRTEHLVAKTNISEDLARRIVTAVDKEAAMYDLDPNFLLALIIIESWGNPEAVSRVGALGLMQVMPATGEYIAQTAGFKWSGEEELTAVESNISYGSWYYHYLLRKFEGDEHAAIAAYNWGPDNIRSRMSRGKALPQVYPGKVYAARDELQGVIWNEYQSRIWRGFDQYVRDARERGDSARPVRRGEYCRLPSDPAEGLCLRDGAAVPASPGDLSR